MISKKEKGFTLIELLAVIVILGLLMAIAIPSVTKYITESRKKTLVKTIDSYITAVMNQVNDGDYHFSDSTKIFAIPIECVSLEKGGTDPFGDWYQANKDYWAYVLVHYDSDNYNYEYGFTFKDSAGYGMYPIEHSSIDGSHIRNGLDVIKPRGGEVSSSYPLDEWKGFSIDNTTMLNVLKSSNEGAKGDGVNTCTLMQKGDNYDDIKEEEKNKILVSYSSGNYFWAYSEQIKTITFENVISIPNDAYKSWDVSTTGNGMVMAYIKPNSSNSSYYDLYIQGDEEIYANKNSSNLFRDFVNVDSINNIEILNTSKVTNMSYMFSGIGKQSTVFKLDLGNNFDTSKVTNMYAMFLSAGYSNPAFTLNLGDNFDTSKVTSMANMFHSIGYSSQVFTLDLGDKFDTSNVTNMSSMFSATGSNSPVFKLDLGDKFDTSKVTNMAYMFTSTGRNSTVFALNLGNKFDTSKVTNMYSMFSNAGRMSPTFTLNLGNKFNTSNVTNMHEMFASTGASSSTFVLDCSSWNVNKVIIYDGFNSGVTSKVIPPNWVN